MRTDKAWYKVKEATKSKKRLIKEAKRAHWRESIHDAATSGHCIWRIAKWACIHAAICLGAVDIRKTWLTTAGGGRLLVETGLASGSGDC